MVGFSLHVVDCCTFCENPIASFPSLCMSSFDLFPPLERSVLVGSNIVSKMKFDSGGS